MKHFLRRWPRFLSHAFILVIVCYQRTCSPDHGIFKNIFRRSRCRFYPSCSEYCIASLRQYGLLRGTVASLKRILRCHPWSQGGYDPA